MTYSYERQTVGHLQLRERDSRSLTATRERQSVTYSFERETIAHLLQTTSTRLNYLTAHYESHVKLVNELREINLQRSQCSQCSCSRYTQL